MTVNELIAELVRVRDAVGADALVEVNDGDECFPVLSVQTDAVPTTDGGPERVYLDLTG